MRVASHVQIVVVDDHPQSRAGCKVFLEAHAAWKVIGEAGTPDEARDLVAHTVPDLVLLDLKLGGALCYDLVRDLRKLSPRCKTLVMSMLDEAVHGYRVLRAGASGFISKEASAEDLAQAVRTVLGGRLHFSEAAIIERAIPDAGSSGVSNQLKCLTNREIEIFGMVGAGKANREIADLLHVSTRTVETHKENIRLKLGLRSMAHVATVAAQHQQRS